ncbi:hypothetical protein SPRG_06339 [Saprolegnia parasitica CBS 223.65]|uniref:Uncharacterized protein n=1 Tax=Saprolegnia parasitica (strain CBS 223.65) TaxID=695850 RepID=A0A067CCT8_SAPPC|nr:hypothetical protein SPRG_06339 [Saprolegnia parasitica CBS 223.65]KDO28288.1 hypothetical protein SPRG_06339 [Saprolegnia parasitica CBS 223.65]|eukprot:XP_012201108.1 hypothetical protein SPRG_06339 [Saprolegnia parasitica CBS 223.65]
MQQPRWNPSVNVASKAKPAAESMVGRSRATSLTVGGRRPSEKQALATLRAVYETHLEALEDTLRTEHEAAVLALKSRLRRDHSKKLMALAANCSQVTMQRNQYQKREEAYVRRIVELEFKSTVQREAIQHLQRTLDQIQAMATTSS